jgi:hypothetical protein
VTIGALVLAMLPGAVALAVSPVPVIAVVLLLVSARGAPPAVAYALAVLGTTAVGVLVVAGVGELLPERVGGDDDPVRAWVTLGSGLLLLALAVQQWVGRRLPDGQPSSTRWVRVFDGVTVGHAVGLGVGQIAANPKNVVLLITAGLLLGESGSSAGGGALAVAVFAVIGSLGVLVPLVWRAVAPRTSARALGVVRQWLIRHGVGFLVAVLVVIGFVFVVSGLVGLR